jgi:hypothetical protein
LGGLVPPGAAVAIYSMGARRKGESVENTAKLEQHAAGFPLVNLFAPWQPKAMPAPTAPAGG